MEQNLPAITKKFWHIVKVAYFMLRKGISKGKLIADLNMMMSRRKIAGKLAAINKLMFHHHSSAAARGRDAQLSYPEPRDEYEFRCSDKPAFLPNVHLPFHLNKRKHSHAPPQEASVDGDLLAAAVEIAASSAAASPVLPGFGRTPMVRQLRITDSPFPLQNVDEEDNNHINEAAEKFIMKFYTDLRRQDL